jgi:Xaa-Pro aminopeptidase
MAQPSEFAERIKQLKAQLGSSQTDLIAIAPTPNMTYLLGFAPKYDERLCLLLVTPQDLRFVVPHLNAGQVETHTGLTAIRWTDDVGYGGALAQALDELGLEPQRVLAADDTMHASDLIALQNAAQPARTIAGDALMSRLRMLKSPLEIERLARAAAQADRAMLAGVAACQPGVTERAVADAIVAYFMEDGAHHVDFTIVGSGPNGAFPHHHSSDRKLEVGDTIIIDIGATLDGYKSDITRIVQLGEPSNEVKRAYELVREANARGRAAVRPGVRAQEVDRATRAPILAAGMGDYFFHRTGHGLGIEEHEPPWISAVSETILEPGMVFSVEPGMYFEGKFGIRIEDIVVVTPDGTRCLTGLDHELFVKRML